MNIDEIKAAIKNEDQVLTDGFNKWAASQTEMPKEAVAEGFKAWEWCKLQLMKKGLTEEHALAVRSIAMTKARRLGTYSAIQDCLFGMATIVIG